MIVVVVTSVVPQHNGDDDFGLLLNDENEYDDVDDVGLLLLSNLLLILLVVNGDEGRRRELVPYYVVVSFEIDWNFQEDLRWRRLVSFSELLVRGIVSLQRERSGFESSRWQSKSKTEGSFLSESRGDDREADKANFTSSMHVIS